TQNRSPVLSGEESALEREMDKKMLQEHAAAPAANATAVAAPAPASTGAAPVVENLSAKTSASATPAPAPAAKTSASPAGPSKSASGNPPAAKTGGTDFLRPKGPVTVTADRAEWQSGGAMVYTGHVALNSENLQLKGVRLELQQFPDGQYLARLNGSPARMDHSGDVDAKGQPQPPVSAEASILTYDSRTSVVDLNGNSVLTRGKDQITGSNIRYNVAERRIQAGGDGGSGQVKIIIQPPPPAAAAATSKPAPAAAEAPLPSMAKPAAATAPATTPAAPAINKPVPVAPEASSSSATKPTAPDAPATTSAPPAAQNPSEPSPAKTP
ncbi:MAG: LptA/OstA family protein, partial [Stenotrophobium sp.]